MSNALDVHELTESIREQHPHQYEEFYDEYLRKYMKKKDLQEE